MKTTDKRDGLNFEDYEGIIAKEWKKSKKEEIKLIQ